MSAEAYEHVGIEVGEAEIDGKRVCLVGLLYETPTSAIDHEFEAKYMSLAAAKALAIDLRDAIDNCEKLQRGESIDGA